MNVHSNQRHGIIILRQAHTECYEPQQHDGGASDEELSSSLQIGHKNHHEHRKQLDHPCDNRMVEKMYRKEDKRRVRGRVRLGFNKKPITGTGKVVECLMLG